MKKSLMVSALLAGGLFTLQGTAFAHGGNYRGPGDTVPPTGGGGGGGGAGPAPAPGGPVGPAPVTPTAPGPVAPGATPGATVGNAFTQGGGNQGPDLTVWSFWWEFNKEPYLNLKSKIHTGVVESGSDSFFLGRGQTDNSKDSLAPSETQIREIVVPALISALEKETNNDIVTGSMIALAKIGDVNSESGDSQFEQIIKGFLSDGNQEISETAAVSLGILANDKSIPVLRDLLQDNEEARRNLVKSTEVAYRTRAFAAYGLGLIGARTSDEDKRKEIIQALVQMIQNDDTRSRDVKVSCLISVGLVPLETVEAATENEDEMPAPWSSRVAQLQFLMDFMQNEDNHFLVRAHCPTALARLVNGVDGTTNGLAGLAPEVYATWRTKIVDDLIARAGKRSKEKNEVIQSSVLALGLLSTNGKDDARIREVLASVPKEVSDQQSRNFSMIAMAKAGGSPGVDGEEGVREAGSFLLTQLSKGKTTIKPWAGLGIGVMSRMLRDKDQSSPTLTAMADALRSSLEDEKDKQKLAAFAIATGIMKDVESSSILLDLLDSTQDNEARGYIAVALGLMDQLDAKEPISEIVEKSKYRPELLKQAAIALGLLGDKELVAKLITMLADSKGLATQAAISSALGFIGDARSIEPLVGMLANKDITDSARGFAAVALGIVADKEQLPWNSKIAIDLNYRASTQTLVDASNGTGILDIL